MSAVALILILLAAAAALDLLADAIAVPHPALLVLAGLALAVTPGLPRAELDPDVVFLVFVPPLLYAAAITTSLRDFRQNIGSITRLGVLLVVLTIVVVAAVAHAIIPRMPWPAAFVLGAIVAPPDVVAVTAVTRRLGIPRQVETILEGEGLINDATALVAYRMAIRSVDSNAFSWVQAAAEFARAAAGGIAVGLAVGAAIVWIRRRVTAAAEVENTISLITPFAAFIPAERLGLSGILAVVAAGLYVARQAPRILSAENRIEAYTMWTIVVFVLEGLIFILIGLDLPVVSRALGDQSIPEVIRDGLVVSAAIIAVRLLWIYPAAYIPRAFRAWRGKPPHYPAWRRVLFVGWAGIRGADSLVIALALPLTTAAARPFPRRGLIIVVTFIVILMTLVIQGLTLTPVLKLLKLAGPDDAEDREELQARLRTAQAGVARLGRLIDEQPALAPIARTVRDRHQHRIHRYAERAQHRRHARDERAAADYRFVRGAMLDAEREELLRLRDAGVVGDAVVRRLQRDLDLEQLLLGSEDPPDGE